MLTFSPGGTAACNPVTNTWHPVSRTDSAMVAAVRGWTGRQVIFWAGSCCDEAAAQGAAYAPAADSWQPPRAPLSARYASGALTGTEVIIVGGWPPLTVKTRRHRRRHRLRRDRDQSVAELVLLDDRFATLPSVVAEGRRVTANIERVANLFITNTV